MRNDKNPLEDGGWDSLLNGHVPLDSEQLSLEAIEERFRNLPDGFYGFEHEVRIITLEPNGPLRLEYQPNRSVDISILQIPDPTTHTFYTAANATGHLRPIPFHPFIHPSTHPTNPPDTNPENENGFTSTSNSATDSAAAISETATTLDLSPSAAVIRRRRFDEDDDNDDQNVPHKMKKRSEQNMTANNSENGGHQDDNDMIMD